MKITYLSPTRFPTERAHGAQIAHMCHAFSELGHDVTLIVPRRVGNPVKEDAFTYYALPKSFTVKYEFCMPWGVGFWFGFWSNFIAYTVRSVFFVLFQKTDLVYSRDEYVLYFLSLFSRKKIVWESHEAKYNFAARALLRKGIRCVVISEGIKEFYLEQGVDEGQLLVAHDGIDESFFGPVESKEVARARLGIKTEKPVAMYIGGFDKWKGVETFFKASEHNDSVAFVVIGGRDEEIERYRKLYPKVTFLGSRPYSELKDNQQAADVLVVPNTKDNDLSAKYTSPLKLFAHLASGVPVVASDIPSIRSVAGDNAVWYFEPDNENDLAEVTSYVLKSSVDSERKSVNAKMLAGKYTWRSRSQIICDSI